MTTTVKDAIEVESVLRRDHVKLVDRCELDVSPTVGHQLGQFGLHRLHLDELGRKFSKQRFHRINRRLIESTHDLGQLAKLFE